MLTNNTSLLKTYQNIEHDLCELLCTELAQQVLDRILFPVSVTSHEANMAKSYLPVYMPYMQNAHLFIPETINMIHALPFFPHLQKRSLTRNLRILNTFPY